METINPGGGMGRGNRKVIPIIPGPAIQWAIMGRGMSARRNTDRIEKPGVEMTSVPCGDIQIPAHTAPRGE